MSVSPVLLVQVEGPEPHLPDLLRGAGHRVQGLPQRPLPVIEILQRTFYTDTERFILTWINWISIWGMVGYGTAARLNISHIRTPNDQTSLLLVTWRVFRTSGAIHLYYSVLLKLTRLSPMFLTWLEVQKRQWRGPRLMHTVTETNQSPPL